MYNKLEFERTVAREQQRDLLHRVEQVPLARPARTGNRPRVKAGPRAWDRLACRPRPLPLDRGADRRSSSAKNVLRLLYALAWMAAKE